LISSTMSAAQDADEVVGALLDHWAESPSEARLQRILLVIGKMMTAGDLKGAAKLAQLVADRTGVPLLLGYEGGDPVIGYSAPCRTYLPGNNTRH
jgi:hypothetical protein